MSNVTPIAAARRPPPPDPSGRRLPANPAVEAALLYAVMSPGICTPEIATTLRLLTPEHFFVPQNARVFEAMKACAAERQTIDVPTLMARLRDVPPPAGGWLRYLTETLAIEGTYAQAPPTQYAKILLDTWRSREIIKLCSHEMARAYDGVPSGALLEETRAALGTIADTQFHGTGIVVHDALREGWKDIVAGRQATDRGLSWGWPSADRSFGRLRAARMTVLAAVPGVGKTNVAWHVAEAVANAPEDEHGVGEAVYFVSGEMKAVELVTRQAGIRAGVPPEATEGERDLTDEEVAKLVQADKEIGFMPIVVDDNGGRSFTVADIESRVREAQLRFAAGTYARGDGALYPTNRLRLVVVDYLTKLQPPPRGFGQKYDSREREVAAISGALTELAKVLNVHVLVIATVSRGGAKGEDARKRELHMPDLRESGMIEYDAASIIFANSPEENMIRLRTDKQRFRKGGYPVDLVMIDGRIFEAEKQ